MRGKLINGFILLVTLFPFSQSFAQQKSNYLQQWRKVDSLAINKGLTQSALVEVNKIYAAAKKEKNEVQVIKALLYRMDLQAQTEEESSIKNIKQLETEISNSSQPSASILKSILAENYWTYFQQKRYELYDRTKTTNFRKEDIATWDVEDFHKKITALYLESISNEKMLQATRLEAFDPIIIKGNMRYLRPTLFDLLAHRALEYFKNDERYLDKPAYAYEIDDPTAFADAKTFAAYNFKTSDSFSLHHKALLLFQRLINFHLRDIKPAALVDADIERISFVNSNGVMADKDSLYEQSLQIITNKYPTERETAQAWYLIAEIHASRAREYDPLKDTSNRYEFIAARKICEQVIGNRDSSEGKANCINLLNEILRKEAFLKTEKVNVPGVPFRTLVSYKNISQVFFRLIKIDKVSKDSFGNYWEEKYWSSILKLPAIKSFSQAVPQTNDHQVHRTEIKIDPLPVGEYALLLAGSPEFSTSEKSLAVQFFYVSNLAYINNDKDYFVLSRQEGMPLENVSIQLWGRKYDYQLRKYIDTKREAFTTNKNGYAKINPNTKAGQVDYTRLELTSKDDHLFMDDNFYLYPDNQVTRAGGYEENNRKTFLFTDRSIYRPAQTVFFKGIVLTQDSVTKQHKIVPNYRAKLFLVDANDEEVDSIQLTTNDFGSYHGKFLLPENRLNGEFKMQDEDGNELITFSVEEYKRPKFKVEYEKQQGTYRLYDTITISGNAKAFAGNSVGNAMVKYRVVRQARFPYPWLLWKIGWPSTGEQEIAHGEVKTATDGKFQVRFAATPDKTIKKEYKPIFKYRVIADITDISGETRSAETVVEVSYQALQLSVTVPQETIPADSLKQVFIKTTNLAGEFQATKITLAIWKLDAPDRLIRKRYWEQQDQFVLSRDEYLKNFPNDEYTDETKKESWKRLEKIYEVADSSRINSQFPIKIGSQGNNARLTPGWYVIEVTTTDKYGELIRDMIFVQLTNSQTGAPALPGYTWIEASRQTKEPGEVARVDIGTSAENVFMIQTTDRAPQSALQAGSPGTENSAYNFLTISKERKTFSIPITESDRGGMNISFAFVKHNRFYNSSNLITVPWTNKELNITYASYRDKTLPGSEEKWKIKLAGYENEKVAAEILASMYDASLDQFKPQQWTIPSIWPTAFFRSFSGGNNFLSVRSVEKSSYTPIAQFLKMYDYLQTNQIINVRQRRSMGFYAPKIVREDSLAGANATYKDGEANQSRDLQEVVVRGVSAISGSPLIVVDGVIYEGALNAINPTDIESINIVKGAEATALYGTRGANGVILVKTKSGIKNNPSLQVRKNFNETAFFFPELRTDTAGNVEFSFTMPESLTQWKWMTIAHTKDLAFGYSEKNIVTQKELMLQPNLPRFLKEGDLMEISTKIVNLADSEVTGQVQLELIDATTNQSVDGWFQNMYSNQYFTAPANGSVAAQFNIQVPHQYNRPVIVRLIARAGNVSDGEENALPVLTNKVLVTETLPLNVRGNASKTFKLTNLLNSASSESLQHHTLTVEFTSNPAWYAVQALPYLMEYPYECAEQVWNRFYANALATKIVNASPKVKEIFEKWKLKDTAALLSNLQKNQELKSVLLEETPWVLEAKSETEQKKRIAALFDMVRMSNELGKNLDQLSQMQSDNGGFVWFQGGPDDRYITQYIISGIGHLKTLDGIPASLKNKIDEIAKHGLSYLDQRTKEDYDRLVKSKADLNKQQMSYTQIQYLYARSFFNSKPVAGANFQAYNYFRKQSQQFWLQQSRYMQGMIALSLFRTGDGKTSFDILNSLKQNAIVNEEMGMYWKEIRSGYYWYQSPIETQALLIEAFATIYKNNKIVDDLRTWLLKNKQTNNWNTTKATAEACYALLLQGTDWLVNAPVVHIKLGDKSIASTEEPEAGTGYFKKSFDAPFINPAMGNITVSVNHPTNQPINQPTTWGAVYWQYFENAENIKAAATPLSLVKKLFVERNTDRGPVIEPVADKSTLKIGDKVKVRIELRVDRDMEYVHMKDMRASAFEPVNVISSYKWQGGLGYYEATKDASTNFFFNYLPKGTYIFEYTLLASQTGTFSNGITTIQCMYAPEFTSHSEGVKVVVEE